MQLADGIATQVKEFQYDWRGQIREDEDRGRRYVWDLFGRLTKVENAVGTAIVSYRYDAFNRQVEKTVDPSVAVYDEITTRYLYDGWRVIEERAVVGHTTHTEEVRARYGHCPAGPGIAASPVSAAATRRPLRLFPTSHRPDAQIPVRAVGGIHPAAVQIHEIDVARAACEHR